jgi:hypothetical protein
MTEEAAEPKKQLGPHDFRFVCVSCRAHFVVDSPGGYRLANEYIGLIGWRVLMRDATASGSGLRCPGCVPAPAEAAAA